MTAQPHEKPLLSGFDEPVFGAQSIFRNLLDAMSRPGLIVDSGSLPMAPAPLVATSNAILLALADFETPLWLDDASKNSEVAREHVRFHCGSPFLDNPQAAVFALITDPAAMPPLSAFGQGSDEYPDRSTTVILQVQALTTDRGMTLSGPGVESKTTLSAAPLPSDFTQQLRANHNRFPQGVDVILAAPDQIAAIPRSARVEG